MHTWSQGTRKTLSIRANMIWNATGSLVYMAAQWLTTVLVVRLSTGYDAAGLLALGMAVSNIFSPIGYYKIRAFQVSDLDEEFTFRQYLGFRIITVVLAIVVMFVYCFLTCPPGTWVTVILYGFFSLGPVFVDVLHGEEQRDARMDIIGISFVLRGILLLASFVIGMALFNSLDIALILMTVTTYLEIALFDGIAFLKVTGKPLRPAFEVHAIKSLFDPVSAPRRRVVLLLGGPAFRDRRSTTSWESGSWASTRRWPPPCSSCRCAPSTSTRRS